MAPIDTPNVAALKPREMGWIPIYGVILALGLFGALLRYTIAYFLLLPAFLIPGWSTALVEPIGWTIALAPIALSLVTVAWPAGAGWLWRQRSGGREPSSRERAAYEEAIAELTDRAPDLPLPKDWFVVDDNTINGAALASTMMLHRATLESDALTPLIAHELGHLNSADARFAAAMNRMTFLAGWLPARAPGRVFAAIRYYLLFVASNAFALWITIPLWGSYSRKREYAADRYAHMLGQGERLAELLDEEAVTFDTPVPFVWMTTHTHPPAELRIDKLRSYQHQQPARQHGTDQPPQPTEEAESSEPIKLAPPARPTAGPDNPSFTAPARPTEPSLKRSGNLLPRHHATTKP
jgi:Zn-dependent protease with chaperone function